MNWLHKLFKPHCIECKEEREDSRVCPSCETLRQQLELANHQNKQLLDRLLEKPQSEPQQKFSTDEKVLVPRTVPWNIRRQMLEAEDRERAKLMREAPKPSTEDLEKELNIASAKREAEG